MAEKQEFDVVIVGGGMAGASLSCALSGQGLRIAMVEAVPLESDASPSYDDRSIALAYGSQRILDTMGLWPAMEEGGVAPIERIHISDRGHMGVTHLDKESEGVEALGYVVESRVLAKEFVPALAAAQDVTLFCPATLKNVDISSRRARLLVDADGEQLDLRAKLIVAADGGKSMVRELQGIQTLRAGYGQTAIIANVTPERSHNNIAYERFTDTGPLALLPMTGNRCSLVWTARDEQVADIMALDDAAFLARLQERFGYRLGEFREVGRRSAYPLGLMHVRERVRPRLAFIGNAAHLLHPVAGQGFNLGLRDVAVLAEILSSAAQNGADVGDMSVLQRYSEQRKPDYVRTTLFTDSLVRIFSNNIPALALARNIGLVALDMLPPLKRVLTRQAMGMNGRLSRLARGVSL